MTAACSGKRRGAGSHAVAAAPSFRIVCCSAKSGVADGLKRASKMIDGQAVAAPAEGEDDEGKKSS